MPAPNRRTPCSVTLLALVVLTFAVFHLLRFFQTLQDWNFLMAALPVHPVYLALTGLVWAVAGGVISWGLAAGRSWAPKAAIALLVSYMIFFWLDRLLLPSSPDRNRNWPFAIFSFALAATWLAWVLRRKEIRDFFQPPER